MKRVIYYLIFFTSFLSAFYAQAATAACGCGGRSGCNCVEVKPDPQHPPGFPNSLFNPFGCFKGFDCPNGISQINLSDRELLNLKNDISQPNAKVATTNSAIQITQTDFESILQAGKSILFSQGFFDYFYMNIGVADAVNAQTWTLPSNFAEYVDGHTSRLDILLPSQIPISMQVAGATHVLKEVVSEPNDGEADSYIHLQVDGTEVTDLGSSYDFDEGSDDNFDEEPDVELYDVPLELGDNQITEDYPIEENDNGNFLKIRTETIVDAFGTINTPYGNFQCLRQTENIKYFRRISEAVAYGTQANYEIRRVKWITKNGFIFSAAVQSEDNNHVGLVGFMELTRFVPTNTLTSQSAVKINNDSYGISINNTDFEADASAILDINSDSQGILIPRITMANRPSSPAEGLLVYQVDNTPGFYYFDGAVWKILSSSASSSMSVSNAGRVLNPASVERGNGQLSNGSTFIKFSEIREDFNDLMINIQLEGDCNGVYISKKTREGFEVKELQKGKSNVNFSWKVEQK